MTSADIEICRKLLGHMNDRAIVLRKTAAISSGMLATAQAEHAAAATRQVDALVALIGHADATYNPVAAAFAAERRQEPTA